MWMWLENNFSAIMRTKWIHEKMGNQGLETMSTQNFVEFYYIGRAEKWNVRSERELFFEIGMTITYLYAYRTDENRRENW